MSLRPADSGTAAALEAREYRPLALVEMDFASGIVRAHSGVGPIVWGGNTYTGVAWLGKVEEWKEGEATEAFGVKLNLSGLSAELVSISLGEHYRGRPLRIWVAFLDEDGRLVGDPLGPWRWRMSTLDGEFSGKTGRLVLAAGSRMALWERASVRRYTDEDHRARHPGDYIFEFTSATTDREVEF